MNEPLKSSPSCIVLTGGGTAGHVWPHFALFDDPNSPLAKLQATGQLKICYIGSQEGMEKRIVATEAPHWSYHSIATGKLRRYFSWRTFIEPFQILRGVIQAYFLLKRERARVVFSKGGFVSAPAVWAAWLQGIPVFIHESDATPALATKLTLPFAKRAFVAFAETIHHMPAKYRNQVEHVGLPLRSSLLKGDRETALSHFQLDPMRKTLLIFGGSLGAAALNKNLAQVLPELAQRLNIIHLVGSGKGFALDAGPFYKQFEFLGSDMALAYAAADFAICRAGASSIFELAAARIPMILVPLGLHQSRGDQIVNATIFASHGWADILDEQNMTPTTILAKVDEVLINLSQRRTQLESAPQPDAAQKIAAALADIVK